MYTNQKLVESRLGTQLTDAQAAYFASLDKGMDAYIDRLTGATFGSDEIVDVYLDGLCSQELVIPTMHDITAVTMIDTEGTETVLPVNDYRVWPAGKPFTFAIRKLAGNWEEGIENYKVTGKLGYPTVPADITSVATELVVNSMNSNASNLKSEKVGDWSATYSDGVAPLSPTAMETLDSYKRLSRSI